MWQCAFILLLTAEDPAVRPSAHAILHDESLFVDMPEQSSASLSAMASEPPGVQSTVQSAVVIITRADAVALLGAEVAGLRRRVAELEALVRAKDVTIAARDAEIVRLTADSSASEVESEPSDSDSDDDIQFVS